LSKGIIAMKEDRQHSNGVHHPKVFRRGCRPELLRILLLITILILFVTTLSRSSFGQTLDRLEFPEKIQAGSEAEGQVFLKDKAPNKIEVQMSSSDPALAKIIPEKVTIDKDTKTKFQIQALAVDSEKIITITAKIGANSSIDRKITVVRVPAPPIPTLTIPRHIIAGNDAQGTVNFKEPVSAAIDFTLRSNNPSVEILPPSIHIAPSQQQASFTLRARRVITNQNVTVTLESGGATWATQSIIVTTDLARMLWLGFFGSIVTFVSLMLLPAFVGVSIRDSWRWLFIGEDGRPSTSKFQNTAWTAVILFAYSSIALARLLSGQHIMLTITPNLVIAMGISIITRVSAKAITVNQLSNNAIVKIPLADVAGNEAGSKGWVLHWDTLRFLFVDDAGRPELGKIQVMAWTFIAVRVYLAEWYAQINAADAANMDLPTIDGALMVLMGLANGGYLGNKLVIQEPLRLIDVSPNHGPVPQDVIITGTDFGISTDVSKVSVLDGNKPTTWQVTARTPKTITIKIPAPTVKGDHDIGMIVDGVKSTNTVKFTVD
jgi:hypothetical protein